MGYSGENVLYRTARYSDPGIERMGYSAALYPIKSLYTPFPRYQCRRLARNLEDSIIVSEVDDN